MEHIERVCIACETEEITEVYQKLETVIGHDNALDILSKVVSTILHAKFLSRGGKISWVKIRG